MEADRRVNQLALPWLAHYLYRVRPRSREKIRGDFRIEREGWAEAGQAMQPSLLPSEGNLFRKAQRVVAFLQTPFECVMVRGIFTLKRNVSGNAFRPTSVGFGLKKKKARLGRKRN